MNELIRITEQDGKQAVSARELHAFLGSKQEFANWIKNRIEKYDLIENEDFTSFDNFIKREKGATVLIEYALTLDCAKELAMVEGNDKGKQARRYFIDCEKRLTAIKQTGQLDGSRNIPYYLEMNHFRLLCLIREYLLYGDQKDIAEQLGVTQKTVGAVLNSRSHNPIVLQALFDRAMTNKKMGKLLTGHGLHKAIAKLEE